MLIPDCAASLFIVYSSVKFDISDSCNYSQAKLTYHKFFWRYVAYEILSAKTESLCQSKPNPV